jgi:hypothetical protein
MEIRPLSLTQVQTGRDGRRYEVTGQAGEIAKQLKELDPRLVVQYNEGGNFFVVISKSIDARGHEVEDLVLRVAADEWDGRVVRYLAPRIHDALNGRSIAGRLDEHDAKHKAAIDKEMEESVASRSYDLMRAIQREVLSSRPRISVPRAIPKGA